MQRYLNKGGDSGISAYETGTDFIKVKFNSGSTYKYIEKQDKETLMQ